ARVHAALQAAALAIGLLDAGGAGQRRGGLAHGLGDDLVAHGVILVKWCVDENPILSPIRSPSWQARHKGKPGRQAHRTAYPIVYNPTEIAAVPESRP